MRACHRLARLKDKFSAKIARCLGITLQQFEQMKSRASGMRRAPSAVLKSGLETCRADHQIILGVDPSLRGTGYGVIHFVRPHSRAVAHGTIQSPAGWLRSRCLAHIFQTLREVVRQHHPTVCVVEGLFYAQNLQTALIMGEARGASLVAVAEAGLEIVEIAPRKVKQAIVGYGAAHKAAVAKMVQRLLSLSEPPSPDAADALALALTFAQERNRYSLTPPKRL
jgi:crossover junction endodeoxyribonuclease RuvC